MSKPHIPYFDFYPADFMNGVRGLTPQEVGVYTMILCRIYEESGPVEYHAERLATYCGMRVSAFEKTMERLVVLGKFSLSEGMLQCRIFIEWGIGFERKTFRVAIPVAVKRDVLAEGDCAYCGSTAGPFEIDHIYPWSRGGKNTRENLTLACVPCNRSKGAMTVEEWLQ